MSSTNGGKLISEMNTFLNDSEVSTDNTSENELPFESLDDFSTDPVGFNELSLRMLNKVEDIFDLAVKYNRHSSRYLQYCAHLEKGIKYLGSACLTKIALQKKNYSFPELGQLSTEKLYRMASFHFRKLDAALTEYKQKHHEMDDALLDMQFRYFNLLQRLRATETRIHKYQTQFYTTDSPDYSPVIHGLAFSDESWVRRIHKQYDEPASFRHSSSYPLLAVNEIKSGEILSIVPVPQTAEAAVCEVWDVDQAFDGGAQELTTVTEQFSEETAPAVGTKAPTALEPTTLNTQTQEVTAEVPASDDENSVEDDISLIKEAELPPSLIIMSQVMLRSEEAGDGSLTFTEDETRILLADPYFCQFQPQLAAQLREAQSEYNSG